MNPDFQSWRRSAHAAVGCVQCHSGGSKIRRLAPGPALSLGHIVKEVTGRYSKPAGAAAAGAVSDAACLRCHKLPKRSRSETLIMDHGAHVKSAGSCLTCHNRTAHPEAAKYEPIRSAKPKYSFPDYIKMRQGCWRCHKRGAKFVDASGVIHTGPYRRPGTGPAPTRCLSCHPGYSAKKLSADVLRARARHFGKAPWTSGRVHGEQARKNFKVCQVCHNPAKRCAVCHQGISMPHAANWIFAHRPVAKATLAKPCHLCHGAVKTVPRCTKCHTHEDLAQPYGIDLSKTEWRNGKEAHGKVVRAGGVAPCLRCHDQATWCTTQCHNGITMPHVAGWRGVHFKYVEFVRGDGWQRKNAVCAMCHNKSGDNPNYCFSCHHQRFGSGSPLGLMRMISKEYKITMELQTEGRRLPCEDCHVHEGLTFCMNCHAGRGDRDLRKNAQK